MLIIGFHQEEEKGTKSQQYFLLHWSYIEICSEIQISKLNNGFAKANKHRDALVRNSQC